MKINFKNTLRGISDHISKRVNEGRIQQQNEIHYIKWKESKPEPEAPPNDGVPRQHQIPRIQKPRTKKLQTTFPNSKTPRTIQFLGAKEPKDIRASHLGQRLQFILLLRL